MHKWLLGSFLFASVSAVAALSSVACSSTPANPYPDVTAFCEAKAKAECSIAATCNISVTTCESVRETVCQTDAAAALADGSREYTSANVAACLSKINAGYAHQPIPYATLEGPGSITDTCERVFAGKAQNNESCTSSYDCVDDRICSPTTPGGTQFVCATPVVLKAGDFCSNPGSECPAGTSCPAPPAGMAATCVSTGVACTTSAVCPDNTTCVAGACVAGMGAACGGDADCGPSAPLCDTNVTPGQCSTGLFTVALGAADCKAYVTAPGTTPPVDASTPPVDAATPVDGATGG